MKLVALILTCAAVCAPVAAAHGKNPAAADAAVVTWFDLSVTNTDQAKAFYGELFRWQFFDVDGYVVIKANGREIGGFDATRPAGSGGAAVYFEVQNLNVTLSRASALGATTVLEPTQTPDGKVWIAMFKDPSGNMIGLTRMVR